MTEDEICYLSSVCRYLFAASPGVWPAGAHRGVRVRGGGAAPAGQRPRSALPVPQPRLWNTILVQVEPGQLPQTSQAWDRAPIHRPVVLVPLAQ